MRTRKLNRNKVRKQPLVTNDYSKEKKTNKKNKQNKNKTKNKTNKKKARNAATAEPISAVSSLPPSSPL